MPFGIVQAIVPLVLLAKVPIVVGEEKLPLALLSWTVKVLPPQLFPKVPIAV